MSVKSGQPITWEFVTSDPSTGAATDADSTPTCVLSVNGTDNGATVIVTKKATGHYKAALTLPTLSAGDSCVLWASATVGGVVGRGIVWQDVADTKRISDLNDLAAGAAMTLTGAYDAAKTAAQTGEAASAVATLHDFNPASEAVTVAGYAAGQSPAEQVRAELTTELARIDVAISTRLAATGYTAPPSTTAIAAAVATALGALTVEVTSPVAGSGEVTIYQGDDYHSDEARQLSFTIADANHLLALDEDGAKAYFKCVQATWEADSITQTDAGWLVLFGPTAAQTAELTHSQDYELEVLSGNGHVITRSTGTLTLIRDIPAFA